MNKTTLQERDAIVESILNALMLKYDVSYKSATAIFASMVTVVINDDQLELLLKTSTKENK